MITDKEILHYIGKQPKHIAGFKQFILADDLAAAVDWILGQAK